MTTQQLDDKVLEAHPFLYRNNRGTCIKEYTDKNGKKHRHAVKFGIPEPQGRKEPDDYPKGGDRVGFELVEIDGRQYPIFCNVEIKGDGDQIKPGQIRFHNWVLSKGGISEIWLGDGRIIKKPLPLDWRI